jgi:pimeloyl-ACP methyl ester carboxylesterase
VSASPRHRRAPSSADGGAGAPVPGLGAPPMPARPIAVVYSNTGHMVMLERPERFNADLRAFIEA